MPTTTTQPVGQPEYVMIVGQGRSGTNWLLDILDQSPRTHCRNEPDHIDGSPLKALPNPNVAGMEDAAIAAGWDAAVRWTSTHMGERDHSIPGPKEHVHELGRRLGLARAVNRRTRAALRTILPGLRGGEWELPGWLGSKEKLAQAMAVLKFVQAPAWAVWAMEHRPQARVLHIVRHPGGFLNSWRNRWLGRNEGELVRQLNRARLDAVRRAAPEWGDRFGDVERMSVVESELWYWRYASETIHAAGEQSSRYQLVVYERLVGGVMETAQRLYAFCGLPWDERIAKGIGAMSGESASIAKTWQSKVTPEDVEAVNRVMAGSTMEHWWENGAPRPVAVGAA